MTNLPKNSKGFAVKQAVKVCYLAGYNLPFCLAKNHCIREEGDLDESSMTEAWSWIGRSQRRLAWVCGF